jgi:hypothetical protein
VQYRFILSVNGSRFQYRLEEVLTARVGFPRFLESLSGVLAESLSGAPELLTGVLGGFENRYRADF